MFNRSLRYAVVSIFSFFLCGVIAEESVSSFSPQMEIVSPSFKKRKFLYPGDVILVVLTSETMPDEPSGTFIDRRLTFFESKPKTWIAFVAVNLTDTHGEKNLGVSVQKDGVKLFEREVNIVVKPTALRPRVFNVKRKPAPEDLERDERDRAEQKELFSRVSSEKFLEGGLVKPVKGASTGKFGRPSIINGEKKSPHSGEDLNAKLGESIKASAKGKVIAAKDYYFLGQTVILDHGYGLFTYYSHLSELNVKDGDLVEKNSVLGKAGMSGRATGVHLHWGVKLGEVKVNPMSMMELPLKEYF